jgi:hypothetical protein
MGGLGSTRWGGHVPKTTVEECLTLSMGVVGQFEGLQKREPYGGTIKWTKVRTGEETARIGYAFAPLGEGYKWDGRLRLKYTITRPSKGHLRGGSDRDEDKTEMEYGINLETTPCNFGGERWWFRCPLVKNGQPCGRRCFKLYEPPGANSFGCREGHDLTYESAQPAHEFDTLYAHIADDMDAPFELVRDALRNGPPGL